MENTAKGTIQKIKDFAVTHKKLSIFIVIVVIVLGYFGFKNISKATEQTSYVTSTVTKGSVFVSVTGSGQVSASNEVDLKAKATSDIVYVGVKAGDVVKKGKLLFSLDARDAQKSVRDAETNLETANLSLEKSQIENSQDSLDTDSKKVYDSAFSEVSNAFDDIDPIMSGLEDMFFAYQNLSDSTARSYSAKTLEYKQEAITLYNQVKNELKTNKANFRLLDRNSSKDDIEALVNDAYDTVSILANTIKATKDFVDYISYRSDRESDYSDYQSTLSDYDNTIDGYISGLLSAKTNIKNDKNSYMNSNLDIRSSVISVEQKQNALQDAKDALSDYYIYAPFNGIISSVTAQLGDTASGTLGTIMTNEKIATISLNEVDIAKIKLGQKVTLTFDAIDTLSLSGEVSLIDSVGTVSQGVVSYNVKISFDVEDDRIKSGMSVSATIITDIAQDVITVPNSAIKNQGGVSYVQTFDTETGGSSTPTIPNQTEVEVGLVDDTNSEIISGLKEGDIIVTKTVVGTTTSTQNTTPSLINAVGGSKTGGSVKTGGGAFMH